MGEVIPFRIERQDDGELRISDVELAEKLGYSRTRDFRRIARTHAARIDRMGGARTDRAPLSDTDQQLVTRYWYTEAQAIFLVSRSDRDIASDIMVEIALRFAAMRRETQRNLPVREWFQLQIIADQISIWEREYPVRFFDHLHRVLGLTKPGRNNHSNCGHFINRYVYAHLFGALGLDVIREANPADDEYKRAVRHHQVLKERHKPALRQHIDKVGAILANAVSLNHFDDMFNRAFPQPDTQIGMMFAEAPAREATP